jgi:hypothetical protein
MFHSRCDNNIVRLKVEAIGKFVDTLCRVLREDNAIGREVGTNKLAAYIVSPVEHFRRYQRLESRSAVNT